MKYSGVEWIGSIPDSWNLYKLGSLFNLRNEKVSDKDYQPLSVSRGGVVLQMENVAKSDASDDRKLVLKGDFAINSRSDRKQSCGVAPFDGSVSLINTILYPKDDNHIYNDYLNYLMKNHGFAEEFYRWGHGIVADLWTTRYQEMKGILLTLPSKDEQKSIFEFLNKKCSEIDELIEVEKKQIESLKEYKDIKISEYYKSIKASETRLFNVCEMVRGPFGSDMKRSLFVDKSENTFKVYSQVNCIEKNEFLGDGYISESYYKEMERFSVREGDILVTCDGTLGKMIKLSSSAESGVIGSSLMRIRLAELDYRYFELVWTYVIMPSITSEIRNSCLQHLPSATKLGKYLIKVPDSTSLKNIIADMSYIETSVLELIELKNKKIEQLKEYKKSLIYEYVTGKKEVDA